MFQTTSGILSTNPWEKLREDVVYLFTSVSEYILVPSTVRTAFVIKVELNSEAFNKPFGCVLKRSLITSLTNSSALFLVVEF